MSDDQNQTSTQQSADDFYAKANDFGVTEDQLKMMTAITEAQVEAAENSADMLDELNTMIKEEQSEE